MSKNRTRAEARRLSLITHHSSLITFVVALAMLMQGCGARHTPNLQRIFEGARAQKGKRPVIVIPGILGTRKTGEVVWPTAFRSKTSDLPLPTTPNLDEDRDDLVASRIVDTAKLAK